eukprot:gene39140-6597_t
MASDHDSLDEKKDAVAAEDYAAAEKLKGQVDALRAVIRQRQAAAQLPQTTGALCTYM